jgi:hypothetical protein
MDVLPMRRMRSTKACIMSVELPRPWCAGSTATDMITTFGASASWPTSSYFMRASAVENLLIEAVQAGYGYGILPSCAVDQRKHNLNVDAIELDGAPAANRLRRDFHAVPSLARRAARTQYPRTSRPVRGRRRALAGSSRRRRFARMSLVMTSAH